MFARKFWKSLVTMAARPSRALESHVTGSGLVAGPGLAMFAAGGLSIRMEREVTECDRKKFKKVFESCDEQNKGYLSREDLKVAVVMLFGYKPSKVEIDSMMLSVHSNSAGVTFDDFLIMMSTKKAAQLSFGEQRQIFSAFDVHCRGFLTLEDFKRAFKYVAQRLPEQTVLEAFREVDQDSDGLICYKDFEFVMNYGEDEE